MSTLSVSFPCSGRGVRAAASLAAALVLGLAAGSSQAVAITSTSFFTASDTLINFDTVPGVAGTPANGQALYADYSSLGVATFRSEDVVGASQATDAADASGRFGATMNFFPALTGGGVPHSGTRYASGLVHLGTPTSDMRIDFASPVSAFGLWVIDNDASTARLQAFDASGALIETRVVPLVGEGGSAFHGIDASASGKTISYVILDGNAGAALDSSFIDDLYVRVAAVPEPGSGALMLAGLAAAAGVVRRRRT
jgi:hypothetical protein